MEEEKWFHPKVHTGWHKNDELKVRRSKALKAHGGDPLETARGLQALSNTTQDHPTAVKAGLDARYFFRQHKKQLRARVIEKFKRLPPRLSK